MAKMLSLSRNAALSISKVLHQHSELNDDQDVIALPICKSESTQRRFRVKVLSGGCSGYQYKFSIDDSVDGHDLVFNAGAFEVVVDKHSLPLIEGSTIDHSASLGGEYFYIKNPNAKASCGCGNSFST